VELNSLRKIQFFSQLNDEELLMIQNIIVEKRYKKGSIIFMEGEKGEATYFIKSGKVKIYKTSKDGRELILSIYGPGSVFAEVTIFNDIEYPATAEVVEDAVLGIIGNSELEKLIRNNSSLAISLLKVLSKRLYNAQLKLKQTALSDTYSRTAETLLRLYEAGGAIELSRQELANMIGTARETVSRILSQFNKDGAIKVSGRKILVKDIDKLKSWL